MIKRILLFLLLAVSSYSLSWQYVVTNGITSSKANYFDIAYDNSNKLYVLYSDTNHSYKAWLIQYNATSNSWSNISTNFTTNWALQMQLFLDTNTYSYDATNQFINRPTNYVINGYYSNINFTTNWATNSIITNPYVYVNTHILSTNRSYKPSTMYIDRGKLYRASYSKYNGTIWDTNQRGFTTNQVSDFRAILDTSLNVTVTNITNAYVYYKTNSYTNLWITVTNNYFTFVFTNIATNTNWNNVNASNKTTINGIDYGWVKLSNINGYTTNMVLSITNTALSTNADGTTNASTNFINKVTNSFILDTTFVVVVYQWYDPPNDYTNVYAAGGEYLKVTNLIYTNIFTNINGITNFSTNVSTIIFTNVYINTYTNMIVNDKDLVTILISDKQRNFKANVMQFTNNAWVYLGTNIGFSSNVIVYPSICKDTNNYWYVGYQDSGYNFKGRVMKYTNGGQWHSISTTNITNKVSSPILKTFGGNFYYAFEDLVTLRMSIYSYTNAGKWFAVANGNVSAGRARYIDMSIWTNGNITVAYADGSTNYRLPVLRYTNSGSWHYLGRAISSGTVYNLKMVLNTNGLPVIIYSANSGKLSVLEYR